MAGVTEAGIGLRHIGEQRRREHVGIERRAIGELLGAVSINRTNRAASEKVAGDFQPVEQRADIAIAEMDGLLHLEILARMAGLAFARSVGERLIAKGRASGIASGRL